VGTCFTPPAWTCGGKPPTPALSARPTSRSWRGKQPPPGKQRRQEQEGLQRPRGARVAGCNGQSNTERDIRYIHSEPRRGRADHIQYYTTPKVLSLNALELVLKRGATPTPLVCPRMIDKHHQSSLALRQVYGTQNAEADTHNSNPFTFSWNRPSVIGFRGRWCTSSCNRLVPCYTGPEGRINSYCVIGISIRLFFCLLFV